MDHTQADFAKTRRCPRIPCDQSMVYRLIEDLDHYEETTKTTNLSFGGCRFLSTNRLERDTLLEIRINADSGVASADAAVVFSRQLNDDLYQVGVKFVRLLPNDRHLLETALPGLRYREPGDEVEAANGKTFECTALCPWFKLRDDGPATFDLAATLVPLRGPGGQVCNHCWAKNGPGRKSSF